MSDSIISLKQINEHEPKDSIMLDQQTLDDIIRRIVEVAQPEKIHVASGGGPEQDGVDDRARN